MGKKSILASAAVLLAVVSAALWNPAPTAGLTANETFVWRPYFDFLRRDPTDAEYSLYAGQLDSGSSSYTVVNAVMNSQEFATGWAYEVWVGYNRQAPSSSTLTSLVDNAWPSGNFLEVELRALESSTYFTYAGSSNQLLVVAYYEDILHRTPPAVDVDYWADKLDTGAYTRRELATFFIRSAEGAQKRVQGLSTQTCEYTSFGGLLTVSSGSYCLILRRPADSSGSAYWQSQLSGSGQLPTLWKSLASSGEYYSNAGSI